MDKSISPLLPAPIIAAEPFRVFFPLGIMAAVAGLLLWPAHYLGWVEIFPAIQHPRIMIFGFGAAFVTGFLGTALPKFVDARGLNVSELSVLVSSWMAAQFFYLLGSIQAGDFAFGVHELLLIVMLGIRLYEGKSPAPPGFRLAYASLFGAMVAAFVWCFAFTLIPLWAHSFLRLLAYEGTLLFPLIGVGSFIFPRVFFAGVPRIPPGCTPSARRRMIGIFGGALLIVISFGIEATGWVQAGNLLRFGAICFWAWFSFPAVFKGKTLSTRAWALRTSLGAIAACFLIRGIWPGPGYAMEHLLFLGGFGVTIPLIADKVIMGHCASSPQVPAKSKAWRWIVWLMWLAFLTRISADIVPSTRVSHHIYASITFIVLLAIWGGTHWKHFHKVSPD